MAPIATETILTFIRKYREMEKMPYQHPDRDEEWDLEDDEQVQPCNPDPNGGQYDRRTSRNKPDIHVGFFARMSLNKKALTCQGGAGPPGGSSNYHNLSELLL